MKMSMTTAQIATEFDTTPRTLRKFLRSNDSGIESVGKGSRYALPSSKRDLTAMRKRFDAWEAARTAPPADDAPDAIDA